MCVNLLYRTDHCYVSSGWVILVSLVTVLNCVVGYRQEAGARGGQPAVGMKLSTLVQRLQVCKLKQARYQDCDIMHLYGNVVVMRTCTPHF